MERHRRTKSEQEYVNAMIQCLSLKRLTDQEIVEYLHNEKQIEIARSTVTNTRNRIEKSAEKWYIELRNSTYRYIATYKERLDSLLSYQKKLHDIIAATSKDEVKIRAISELSTIEMNIFSLWKQLPNLDILDQTTKQPQEELSQEEKDRMLPIVSVEDINGVEELPAEVKGLWHSWVQCDGCKRWWSSEELLDYHKRKSSKTECNLPNIA